MGTGAGRDRCQSSPQATYPDNSSWRELRVLPLGGQAAWRASPPPRAHQDPTPADLSNTGFSSCIQTRQNSARPPPLATLLPARVGTSGGAAARTLPCTALPVPFTAGARRPLAPPWKPRTGRDHRLTPTTSDNGLTPTTSDNGLTPTTSDNGADTTHSETTHSETTHSETTRPTSSRRQADVKPTSSRRQAVDVRPRRTSVDVKP